MRLDDVSWRDGQTLEATVPPGLLPGSYDLAVVDPLGRTATLKDAYAVVVVEEAETRVKGYVVDAIPAQRVSAPFNIRMTAVDANGARVEAFNGGVTLSDNSGALVPALVDGFIRGERVATVDCAVRGPWKRQHRQRRSRPAGCEPAV